MRRQGRVSRDRLEKSDTERGAEERTRTHPFESTLIVIASNHFSITLFLTEAVERVIVPALTILCFTLCIEISIEVLFGCRGGCSFR